MKSEVPSGTQVVKLIRGYREAVHTAESSYPLFIEFLNIFLNIESDFGLFFTSYPNLNTSALNYLRKIKFSFHF